MFDGLLHGCGARRTALVRRQYTRFIIRGRIRGFALQAGSGRMKPAVLSSVGGLTRYVYKY